MKAGLVMQQRKTTILKILLLKILLPRSIFYFTVIAFYALVSF